MTYEILSDFGSSNPAYTSAAYWEWGRSDFQHREFNNTTDGTAKQCEDSNNNYAKCDTLGRQEVTALHSDLPSVGERATFTLNNLENTEVQGMSAMQPNIVKVCADPNCRVHHGDKASPQRLQRERTEERKRIEKENLALTVRHRIHAAILERVSAPMKKADLLTIAQHSIGGVRYNRVPVLAKRHKAEPTKETEPPVESLLKHISSYDEAALSRLLLEISLLDVAYRNGGRSENDILLTTAKRYRIDQDEDTEGSGAGSRSQSEEERTQDDN